ncbi:MAG TPA: hypothetical protein VMF86_19195 [Stellaceae bacterium]|nr:hypothetical protein [Stellaceae bacterium]
MDDFDATEIARDDGLRADNRGAAAASGCFVVPLALPGDDVTPDQFIGFLCDGGCGLYIHPNIWHGAIVPLADNAELLDRQGRVHARVSVDFAKEFGCYLAVPLPPLA